MITSHNTPGFAHKSITADFANSFEFPAFLGSENEFEDRFEDFPEGPLDLESEDFALFAQTVPIEAMQFLREFIINSAFYVEELESALCERSDDFWETREHAYRIVTGLLLSAYEAADWD